MGWVGGSIRIAAAAGVAAGRWRCVCESCKQQTIDEVSSALPAPAPEEPPGAEASRRLRPGAVCEQDSLLCAVLSLSLASGVCQPEPFVMFLSAQQGGAAHTQLLHTEHSATIFLL